MPPTPHTPLGARSLVTTSAFIDVHPSPPARHTLRALLALVTVTGLLLAALAAIAYGNPDVVVVEPVATAAAGPGPSTTVPVHARNLSVAAGGAELRAERDAALAAATQMAEQEAADQAAAEAEAAAAAEAQAQAQAQAQDNALAAEQPEREQAAVPTEAPAVAGPAPTPVQGDPFDALAQCESGGNPGAVNAAGPYYGAFQFSQGTWDSVAPDMPGRPTQYSYAQQKTAAQRLQAARGWSPWPHCARQLGLL
jgi:hypothetical protein